MSILNANRGTCKPASAFEPCDCPESATPCPLCGSSGWRPTYSTDLAHRVADALAVGETPDPAELAVYRGHWQALEYRVARTIRRPTSEAEAVDLRGGPGLPWDAEAAEGPAWEDVAWLAANPEDPDEYHALDEIDPATDGLMAWELGRLAMEDHDDETARWEAMEAEARERFGVRAVEG